MRFSDWISIGSLILAAVAFLYTYLTNTKKYELSAQFRNDILTWYSETVQLLVEIRLRAQVDPGTVRDVDVRSRLSSLIERGRFYFPNKDEGDGFGADNLPPYRGHRSAVLYCLVTSYRITSLDDPSQHVYRLELLEKMFTSLIFSALDPKGFLEETHRLTGKANEVYSNLYVEFDDFIAADSEQIKTAFREWWALGR